MQFTQVTTWFELGDNFLVCYSPRSMVTGMSLEEIEIVPFTRTVSREGFSCGNTVLDNWLKQFAGQNEDRFRTRTFLAINRHSAELLGYYTTVFTTVEPSVELSGAIASKYKRPAYLIARLAVDQSAQGKGVGKVLLWDALSKASRASKEGGLEVVVVDAKDDGAISFYGKFGFVRIDPYSNRMFLSLSSLQDQ